MLNYRHLYYFWVVAKEGGFARAAERLDMAVQTISAQVRKLEKALCHQLLGQQHSRRDVTPNQGPSPAKALLAGLDDEATRLIDGDEQLRRRANVLLFTPPGG